MQNSAINLKRNIRTVFMVVAACLAASFTQGCNIAPSITADACKSPEMTDEIRQDIANRHFGGDTGSPAFRKGVRQVSLDRSVLEDALRDPAQAALYRHLTESVYVLAVDPEDGRHALVYKDGKLLFEHAMPPEHFEVLQRLFERFDGVSLPENSEEEKIVNTEEFLKEITESVAPECKKGIEQTLRRAGRNARELIRAVRMLETEEEKQDAYWLLGRMKDHAYICIYREKEEKVYYYHYDAQQLSAADFYEIVHYAYRARHAFPWARQLPEDRFRRFVLEYRQTEAPAAPGLRAHMFRALEPYVKNLDNIRDVLHQVNRICSYLVIYRKDMVWEDQDMRMMFATNQARCEGKSNLASAMLRSVGVPNCYIHTPAWPTVDGNHAWNGAFDGEEILSFMGCAPRREKPYFNMYKDSDVAKVYYREPNVGNKDITSLYTPTTEYTIQAGKEFAGQMRFLNVWNSKRWQAVAKATVDENGAATFKDIGCRRDFLFSVTEDRPKAGCATMRTVIITKEGKAVDVVTGETDSPPAPLVCLIEDMKADTQYTLKTWTGSEWREVAAVTSNAEGVVNISGEEKRLYKLDDAEGNPATRPFQIKTIGEKTEPFKY